ncbi:hypothetical protein BpHYR1_054288, partial [Brachionus plicatilis]
CQFYLNHNFNKNNLFYFFGRIFINIGYILKKSQIILSLMVKGTGQYKTSFFWRNLANNNYIKI